MLLPKFMHLPHSDHGVPVKQVIASLTIRGTLRKTIALLTICGM